MMLTPDDEARAIKQLVERLATRYPQLLTTTVLEAVNTSYQQFAGRPIRDFIPVLVEREVREQLATYATGRVPQLVG